MTYSQYIQYIMQVQGTQLQCIVTRSYCHTVHKKAVEAVQPIFNQSKIRTDNGRMQAMNGFTKLAMTANIKATSIKKILAEVNNDSL